MKKQSILWQRVENVFLFAFSVWMYGQMGWGWDFFALLFFSPDFFMIGYLRNENLGAWLYNLGHHYGLALTCIFMGLSGFGNMWTALGWIWMAHLAFDRILGYGLKEKTSFKDTHLSSLP